MRKGTFFALCLLTIGAPCFGQKLADSLTEHRWDGRLVRSADSTETRFSIYSRLLNGNRYLYVEKLVYACATSNDKSGTDLRLKNTLLFSLCCDELFPGIDKPSDPDIPIELEEWESPCSAVLKVGSTRYLINLEKLPLTDIHAIDAKGHVIDLPPDE